MNLYVEDGTATIQDRGRAGFAHLGVGRAGALDSPAVALGNRLVGNDAGAAAFEMRFAPLVVVADRPHWVAVTGAPCEVVLGDARAARTMPHGQAFRLPAGTTLRVGLPRAGVCTYLAVGGGLAVEPILGSRSWDTLAGLRPGGRDGRLRHRWIPVGAPQGEPRFSDVPPPRSAGPMRVIPGPHPEWFAPDVLERLCRSDWTVDPATDRIGMRLAGPALPRREGELPSEGMVLGAIQVPPAGRPIVFLADHPPTGGYPVAGVVHPDDLWRAAQARPGEAVRFTPAR